ncbi:hypothetical protein B0H13DRAFT_1913953 [Mycena leptocephala]|nr:hypothetical protein B0H13DRAFT_1913953 [Mycena leptocephala]
MRVMFYSKYSQLGDIELEDSREINPSHRTMRIGPARQTHAQKNPLIRREEKRRPIYGRDEQRLSEHKHLSSGVQQVKKMKYNATLRINPTDSTPDVTIKGLRAQLRRRLSAQHALWASEVECRPSPRRGQDQRNGWEGEGVRPLSKTGSAATRTGSRRTIYVRPLFPAHAEPLHEDLEPGGQGGRHRARPQRARARALAIDAAGGSAAGAASVERGTAKEIDGWRADFVFFFSSSSRDRIEARFVRLMMSLGRNATASGPAARGGEAIPPKVPGWGLWALGLDLGLWFGREDGFGD